MTTQLTEIVKTLDETINQAGPWRDGEHLHEVELYQTRKGTHTENLESLQIKHSHAARSSHSHNAPGFIYHEFNDEGLMLQVFFPPYMWDMNYEGVEIEFKNID